MLKFETCKMGNVFTKLSFLIIITIIIIIIMETELSQFLFLRQKMKYVALMARFTIFLIISCCWFLSTPIHHFQERKAFVRENTNRAHGKVYKFNTSVISAHVFDQVHIFFFFVPCIFFKVDSKPTVILEYIGTWTVLGKEDLDDNCHQL